jgi:ATP-dependent DNA helicase RecG
VDDHELMGLLTALRTYGAEDTGVEAKRASTQLPSTTVETFSAFANTPGGGMLLLGVDESSGFAVTGVGDPAKIQQDLGGAARTRLTPPLQPSISIHSVEGKTVVAAEIRELAREEKPCYVTSKGMTHGSFLRVADGDRRLTPQEIHQLVADRGQPRFDHEIVLEATVSDLDDCAVQALLGRLRNARPHLFGDMEDTGVLRMLGVLKEGNTGVLHPSLAGLLALGVYPQQYFPQLCATFVHYPTPGGEQDGLTRFLDNVRIDGSIPRIVEEALRVIQRNMSRRALISDTGRHDVWEYPPRALREAVVNALVHRDLSPGTRGTHVQMEMYPDRLRIMNPGGLFGAVDISRLGEEGVSSSRNSLLMRLLEDVPLATDGGTVCENRGSGVRTMRTELVRAGMSPPEFLDKVTSFTLLMPNHTLVDEKTVEWLSRIGKDGLKDTQCTALALLRSGQTLDNTRYRAATGISDSRVATAELQDLVARELVDQSGTRRGARYSLSEYARQLGSPEGKPRKRPNRRRQILSLLSLHGDLSTHDISTTLNINPKTAAHWLSSLKKEGRLELVRTGTGNRNVRYRLVDLPSAPGDPEDVSGQEQPPPGMIRG